MKRFWLIALMLTFVAQCTVFALDNENTLKETKVIDPNKSYICGKFIESKSFQLLIPTEVYVKIVNVTSNEAYYLQFIFRDSPSCFEIPEGGYRIDSFFTKYFNTSTHKEEFETVLKVNPCLLAHFQLKAGEILYLGDYKALKSFSDQPRTAKVTITNRFDKMAKSIKERFRNKEVNLKSLDIQEVSLDSYKYTSTSASVGKCYIAGKFRFTGPNSLSSNDYYIVIYNMWTHKQNWALRFKGAFNVQYVALEPGEYVISVTNIHVISWMDQLLPTKLKTTFTLNPGEVLYLGEMVITERGLGSMCYFLYKNDLEESRSEILNTIDNQNLVIIDI